MLARGPTETICIPEDAGGALPTRIGCRLRPMTFDVIRSDFALLDDWEDRYRYVI